jgi:hypothetical protein
MNHDPRPGFWAFAIALTSVIGASAVPSAASPPSPPATAALAPATAPAKIRRLPPPAPVPWQTAVQSGPVRFATDVVPILTRAGCNQGACHGAQSGQGGLKQSLRGWDPAYDWEQFVKDADGKRIDKKQPEKSLVYLKPTGQVSHGGGQRFKPSSPEAQVLLRWLKDGAAGPDETLVVRELTVSPAEQVLERKGTSLQIRVVARMSDGTARDVTDLARYSSYDEGVASVSESGHVTALRGGESAIMVSYAGFVKVANVVVPLAPRPLSLANLPRGNWIDSLVYPKLAQLRIEPSGPASESEFLRRVYLDTIATLPTPAEARSFLRDREPEKRRKLIDRLLERPEYVDFQALKLADLLRVNSLFLSDEGADRYYRWIHDRIAARLPYDQLVRELLTGRGSTYRTGPANYFRVAGNPEELAETTSQTFLGVRLQCAKCHNHPFEKWTQNDYYSLAAFFARVGRKGGPEFGEEQVFVRTAGEVVHPKTKKPLLPRSLGAAPAKVQPEHDRRAALAGWLTSRGNRQFARVAVNRIWAEYFGRGIVDPIDDFRVSNPPANGPLLERLATEFTDHGFDVRHVTRLILNSRAYQASSIATPTNRADERHFARALPRRLTAEQAMDAIAQVTGKSDRFGNRPMGTRAIQLRDSRSGAYFLEVFGRPKREINCACERDMGANLSQSLHLINSPNLNGKLRAEDGRLTKLVKAGWSDLDIINELYLATLSRYPTPQEVQVALKQVRVTREQRTAALEDLLWALVNTQEFLYNH